MAAAATQTVAVPSSAAPTPAVAAGPDSRWKQVEKLPCNISVEAHVPGFTLNKLLELRVKSVVRSQLPASDSPAVRVNGAIVASGDFEVLGKRLAVRLTELE